MKKIIIAIFMGVTFLTPAFIFAQTAATPKEARPGYHISLPCTDSKDVNLTGTNEKECGFTDLINQVQRVIELLLYLATVLAIISFIYAGFKLLFSGGNEEAMKQAKSIFSHVIIGLIMAYGAWIIVNFLISSLGGVNPGFTLLQSTK